MPCVIRATLDDLSREQRGLFGNHVDFSNQAGASLRVEARAVWDPSLEVVEVEHTFPKTTQRSSREQREKLPLIWLPAARDVTRLLQFGVARSIMGQLLDELPISGSLDQAVDEIQAASEQFGRDAEIAAFLGRARDALASLLPGVDADAYSQARCRIGVGRRTVMALPPLRSADGTVRSDRGFVLDYNPPHVPWRIDLGLRVLELMRSATGE